jgi:hypothetical protein
LLERFTHIFAKKTSNFHDVPVSVFNASVY